MNWDMPFEESPSSSPSSSPSRGGNLLEGFGETDSVIPEIPSSSPPVALEDLSSMLGIDEAREARDAAFEEEVAKLYAQQKAHAAAEEYEEAGWVKSQIEGLRMQKEREDMSRPPARMSSATKPGPSITSGAVSKRHVEKVEAKAKAVSGDDLLSGVDPNMVARVEEEEVNQPAQTTGYVPSALTLTLTLTLTLIGESAPASNVPSARKEKEQCQHA